MRKTLFLAALLGVLVLYSSASAIESNSPIAHWKLDENGGSTAYDSAGFNDGTIYGAAWTGGQIGGALDFGGCGDYVRTTYEGGPSEYTISLWYNLNEDINNSTFTGYRALVSKTGDETPLVNLWNVWFTVNGLALDNEKSHSNYVGVAYEPAMFYKDQWHHVVVTGTTTEGKIYFDGELKNTTADNFVTGAWDDTVAFDIAKASGSAVDRFFNGKIDDVKVYFRVLSDEEVQQLYQEGSSGLDFEISTIEYVASEKENMLGEIDELLGKEQDVYNALEAMLETKDYGDLEKGDIAKAERKIRSAMQNQERSISTLETSIGKLEETLIALGYDYEPEPEPNLVSHWDLNENVGTIAYDSLGSNDGTVHGAAWTSGQIGGALDFDGTNDYVSIPDSADLSLNDSFTISLWFNQEQLGRQALLSKFNDVLPETRSYSLRVSFDSKIRFLIFHDGTVPNKEDLFSNAIIEADRWYHLVAVLKTGAMEIYIDGTLDNSTTISDNTVYDNPYPLYIGKSKEKGADYFFFDGKIDDVKIYNRALSAPEVQLLYGGGL